MYTHLIVLTLSSYLEVKIQSTDILKKDRCLTCDQRSGRSTLVVWKRYRKSPYIQGRLIIHETLQKCLLPYPKNMSLVVGRMPMICLGVSASVYSVYALQMWFPKEMIDAFCTTARKWSNIGGTDDLKPGYTASILVINLFFNIQANVLANNKMWPTHL